MSCIIKKSFTSEIDFILLESNTIFFFFFFEFIHPSKIEFVFKISNSACMLFISFIYTLIVLLA